MLSYSAWQKKFGGDSSIVGHRLVEPLSRWEYTVIGVAPPGLGYPAGADYWIPLWGGWQSAFQVIAVARLAPGSSVAAAGDEYLRIEQRLNPQGQLRRSP